MRPVARYFRPDTPILQGWLPALREARTDVRSAYTLAAARSIDALQNSGFIAGAVQAVTGLTVGSGLQLNAKPAAHLFGRGTDGATARDRWARETEADFDIFARNPLECDAAGKRTLGQMMVAGFRHWLATGEILATLTAEVRPGTRYATKVRMLPSWRMPLTSELPNLIDGVRVDGNGMPVAYRINEATAYGTFTEKEVRARDAAARPLVIHVIDGDIEAVRGISLFAPVLKVLRQYDQLADATLMTTLLQTIFAATISSANAPEGVFEALQPDPSAPPAPGSGEFEAWMQARLDWYEKTKINLGQHARLVHLFPQEKLDFHGAEHPSDNYDAFGTGLLREIMVCIAVTPEIGTGDYRNANFSSANVGLASIFPVALYRRQHIVGSFAHGVYDAWLEEGIASGRRPFPGGLRAFLANRSAATMSDWRGPARPTPDELKTARASEIDLDKGLVTLEDLCAARGRDWQDVADQRKRERDYYVNVLGLPDPFAAAADRSAADAHIAATEQ
jgi:lambda family phage portal protein